MHEHRPRLPAVLSAALMAKSMAWTYVRSIIAPHSTPHGCSMTRVAARAPAATWGFGGPVDNFRRAKGALSASDALNVPFAHKKWGSRSKKRVCPAQPPTAAASSRTWSASRQVTSSIVTPASSQRFTSARTSSTLPMIDHGLGDHLVGDDGSSFVLAARHEEATDRSECPRAGPSSPQLLQTHALPIQTVTTLLTRR